MQKQSLRFLPANKTPQGTRCITLEIPDDDEWERDAFSELSRLGIWALWERDPGKNGAVVARQWRTALKTWKHCPLPTPPSTIGGSFDDCEVDMFRKVCEDGVCYLEFECCPGEWTRLANANQIGAPNQPGAGQPQPPAGTCQTYDLRLNAAEFWLLPTALSSGDTIELTNLKGATHMNGELRWNCPDGQQFFLGGCVGEQEHLGGDPSATAFHGEIVVNMADGSFLRAIGAPATVPSGVLNRQVSIQANFQTLTDASGDISGQVTVCKNARPETFYYGLYTNIWAVGHDPSQITWNQFELGVPTTITSMVPADPSHPDNVRAFLDIKFAKSFDSSNYAQNPDNVWYKMSFLSVSGATFDSGNIYEYNQGSGCSGSGSTSGSTSTPPTIPGNQLVFEIQSRTQFVVVVQIDLCT